MANKDQTTLAGATKVLARSCFCLYSCLVLCAAAESLPPLSLHPDNPHYFLFRGNPLILITSGEHYGAVLNMDFDYKTYLDTLHRDGMNGTRIFSGAYCEPPDAFEITGNTLSPAPGRLISPWARSDQPACASGGNKFDLKKWDGAYFKRLHDFMSRASERGIIVEMSFFCPFYNEEMWKLSPMNAVNNINGIGRVPSTNVYALEGKGGLLEVQEAMVRKIVTELGGFDNLYYEICNEPYAKGIGKDWQRHIASVITGAESGLPRRHLVSENVANGGRKVVLPDPGVSIFNFHYATPPDAVAMNYELNKLIGDNETGFKGTNDAPYRMEAWDFVVAGGGLFNHLDYSFSVGREDGTFSYPSTQPGGGSAGLRRQFRILSEVMRDMDFIRMKPANDLVKAHLPRRASVRTLARPGHDYLIYVRTALGVEKEPDCKTAFARNELRLRVNLAAGRFQVGWIDPKTGGTMWKLDIDHAGGSYLISAPAFSDDIALRIRTRP